MAIFGARPKPAPVENARPVMPSSMNTQAVPFRLFEIGKIKIGGRGLPRQGRNGGTYYVPEKYDHFVVTTCERGEDGNFRPDEAVMSKIRAEYGEKCTRLPVRLLYDDPFVNFPHWFAQYQGGKCLCRGDGVRALRAEKGAQPKEIQCTGFNCPNMQDDAPIKCKPTGLLNVALPFAEVIGGVYVFRTCSVWSVQNIRSSLQWMSTLTGGHLMGLGMELVLYQKTVQIPDGVTTVGVVNLEFPGGPVALREHALAAAREFGEIRQEMKLLEQTMRHEYSKPEAARVVQDVEDEFAPENNPNHPEHGTMQEPADEPPVIDVPLPVEDVPVWMDQSKTNQERWMALGRYTATELKLSADRVRAIITKVIGTKPLKDWTNEDFERLQAAFDAAAR